MTIKWIKLMAGGGQMVALTDVEGEHHLQLFGIAQELLVVWIVDTEALFVLRNIVNNWLVTKMS